VKLDGVETINPSKLPNLAWTIKYDDIEFDKFKIEGINKGSGKVYNRDELFQTECKNIDLLKDADEIKSCGGVNIYISSNKVYQC